MILDVFRRLCAPLRTAIVNKILRGVVELVVDDQMMQRLQITVLKGDVQQVERFQDYGVTSHPHPGAEVITASLGMSRDHSVVLRCDDRRYRVTQLAQGEVAIYTDEGDTIHLKRGNLIEVSTKTFKVNAETIDLTATNTFTLEAGALGETDVAAGATGLTIGGKNIQMLASQTARLTAGGAGLKADDFAASDELELVGATIDLVQP